MCKLTRSDFLMINGGQHNHIVIVLLKSVANHGTKIVGAVQNIVSFLYHFC